MRRCWCEQPIVPVDGWFQVEAHYRNATDSTGELTIWLGDVEIIDLAGATAASPWIQWVVSSLGQDLTPSGNVLYVDDCAIGGQPLGTHGLLPGP